ncbi:MAG: DUF1015 domain-containing protein [Clostridia bacterium]
MSIKIPNIYLPNRTVDYSKWAVIACDQFTSQPAYWDKVNELTKDAYSTRHIVLPEIYLNKINDAMLDDINTTMQQYCDNNVLVSQGQCFILTVRSTPFTPRRIGLMIAVDLEDYDYAVGSTTPIRATEGTVLERIPPRVRIRKNALLELPHILVLFNDKQNKVLGSLYENRKNLPKLYDFDLMCNGGHIEGYRVDNCFEIIEKLKATQKDSSILLAVGDGNHSLATAKAIWEETKKTLTPEQRVNHPARFALCEATNLYDEGIAFEPIHRVVFNANQSLIDSLQAIGGKAKHKIYFEGKELQLNLPSGTVEAIKIVQQVIDDFVKANPNSSVDYVHGDKDAVEVSNANPSSLAILLPTLAKKELFAYVEEHGALPRKTFSMGEAVEKRYYIEARKIR